MCLGKLYKKVTTGSVISCNVLRRELEIITPDLLVVVNPEIRIMTSKSKQFFLLEWSSTQKPFQWCVLPNLLTHFLPSVCLMCCQWIFRWRVWLKISLPSLSLFSVPQPTKQQLRNYPGSQASFFTVITLTHQKTGKWIFILSVCFNVTFRATSGIWISHSLVLSYLYMELCLPNDIFHSITASNVGQLTGVV